MNFYAIFDKIELKNNIEIFINNTEQIIERMSEYIYVFVCFVYENLNLVFEESRGIVDITWWEEIVFA